MLNDAMRTVLPARAGTVAVASRSRRRGLRFGPDKNLVQAFQLKVLKETNAAVDQRGQNHECSWASHLHLLVHLRDQRSAIDAQQASLLALVPRHRPDWTA